MKSINGINRKEQIYYTAAKLFKELGYHGTSMRQLAKEVGIETASIYSHIASKDELLKYICINMADCFFDAMDKIDMFQDPADIKLKKVIIAHIKVVAENINAAPVFFHDWRHLPEPYLSRFKKLQHLYENIFRKIVNEGIKAGIFRPTNEKFIVLTILSALNWTHEWYKPEGEMDAEEIGNGLADLLINGLKHQKAI